MSDSYVPPKSGKPRMPGNNSFGKRIGIIIGAAVAVMIVLGIITMFLPKGGNSEALIKLAQAQTELARISQQGSQQGKSQATLNLAQNSQLSLLTSQGHVVDYLAKHGTKVNKKSLSATKDTQTDAKLKAAASASNFDEVFNEIFLAQLNAYIKSLKTTYDTSTIESERQLIKQEYDVAQLLLEQTKL